MTRSPRTGRTRAFRGAPRRGLVALLPLVLAATALLAACGGDDDATESSAEPAVPPETATAATMDDGSAQPRVARDGDSVTVHYHGTLDSGEVFDSSRERSPLPFVVGAGQVIAGFDAAVRGLAVGESVTVRLDPADAYGERRDDLVVTVPAEQAPAGLTVGDVVQVGGASGIVTEVTSEFVRVDANHRLAGQALTFGD